MAATAFKRDLSDFKTILDFCEAVQSPERLRLLIVLTVVDIRAVGPGVWNGWKRQLLTNLYDAAEEVLMLGHKHKGRSERIAAKQADLVPARWVGTMPPSPHSSGGCPKPIGSPSPTTCSKPTRG